MQIGWHSNIPVVLDEVRAEDFRDRVFHLEDVQRLREERQKSLSGRFHSKMSNELSGKTANIGGSYDPL